MNRQLRLEELKKYLLSATLREHDFDTIYQKLLDEIDEENRYKSNKEDNSYLKNLLATKEKQAKDYINLKSKNNKKDYGDEFSIFINHFQQDVTEELWFYFKKNSNSTIENEEI